MNFQSFYISLKLGLLTSVILLVLSLLYSFYFRRKRGVLFSLVENLVTLPIVLPPTVLGFYFLVVFGGNSVFGSSLVFSFNGILLGSIIYSAPFMFQPILNTIRSFDENQEKAAMILGASDWRIFKELIIPFAKKSIASSFIITFLHTIGEFGIVLMIGGSLPGETKTVSIEIFEQVEAMNYSSAHIYSMILIALSIIGIISVNLLTRKKS